MTMQRACRQDEAQTGSLRGVEVGGRAVVIANLEGRYFAIDDVCTHVGCSLTSEGSLSGHVVTCACHGSQFDARTGQVLQQPARRPLPTYRVELRGDDVFVDV